MTTIPNHSRISSRCPHINSQTFIRVIRIMHLHHSNSQPEVTTSAPTRNINLLRDHHQATLGQDQVLITHRLQAPHRRKTRISPSNLRPAGSPHRTMTGPSSQTQLCSPLHLPSATKARPRPTPQRRTASAQTTGAKQTLSGRRKTSPLRPTPRSRMASSQSSKRRPSGAT